MSNLFIVPMGGLVNRLMGIISGIRVAQYYSWEPHIVWHKNSSCYADWNNLFDNCLSVMSQDSFHSNNHFLKIRIDSKTISHDREKTILNLDKFNNDIYLETNCFIGHEKDNRGGGFWNFSESILDTKKYFNILNPSTEIINGVDQFLNKFKLEEVVGIHVRRGTRDNPDAVKGFNKVKNSDYETILSHYTNPHKSCFFLATDDRETEYFFKNKYGKKCLKYSVNSFKKDVEYQAIIDAFVDLILLSKTRKIIGVQGSSFAYFASLIDLKPYIAIVSDSVNKKSRWLEHIYEFENGKYKYTRNNCFL